MITRTKAISIVSRRLARDTLATPSAFKDEADKVLGDLEDAGAIRFKAEKKKRKA